MAYCSSSADPIHELDTNNDKMKNHCSCYDIVPELDLFNRIGKAIFCIDVSNNGNISYVSRGGAELLSMHPEDIKNQKADSILPRTVSDLALDASCVPNRPPRSVETVIPTTEIPDRCIEWTLHQIIDFDERITLVEARDITPRKRNEHSLQNLSRAVEQSPVVVLITDINGIIEYVNPRFTQVTGYSYSEAIGSNPSILKSGFSSPLQYKELWTTVISGKEWTGEFLNRKKSGELFWEHISISPVRGDDGEISKFIAVKEDITIRKENEKRITYQAHYDVLTKLPNRILVTDRLSQALTRAKRNNAYVGVAFLDLDGFKKVNDTLGHSYGDDLLRQAARRLMTCVRASDTVGRLGGDEFLVIIPDLQDKSNAEIVTNNILKAFSKPFSILTHSITTTASIGLSIYPTDGEDIETLMRNADTAMYSAKEAGRNCCGHFHAGLNEYSMRRLRMESLLSGALARNEMHLLYQPQVSTNDGRLIGAEALLRWDSPELGMVPPLEFIRLAEDTGIIEDIGEFVLKAACQQLAEWREHLPQDFRISINASPRQFTSDKFIKSVMQTLEETHIPYECLEIEITEGLFALNSQDIIEYLHRLSKHGIRIAVDDFGTGYSSLNYLREFPVNTVKIDRSFMIPVGEPAADSLVRAIVAMSHSLGLDVIGEGVETQEQMTFLKNIDCDMAQGFIVDKPLSVSQFQKYIAAS